MLFATTKHCRVFLSTSLLVAIVIGCNRETPPETFDPSEVKRPLGRMRVLGRNGKWEDAWKLHEMVLEAHADDAEAITYVARVAHNTGRAQEAADYLEMASTVEDYASPKRVDETLIAMISAGRTHDAMDFLSRVVDAHPDRHETRRVLFDLQMGTEERGSGLQHGRRLIQERQFDLELLMNMTDTEIRSMDAKPLDEMVSRNPDDLRPLIGAARSAIDQNLFDEARESLDKIVDQHPKFATAAAMRMLLLAQQADWTELEASLPSLPSEVTQRRNFWIAIGMWSEAIDNQASAARSYWRAAKLDPDISLSWLNLQQVLQLDPSLGVAPETIEAIGNRAEQLNRFNQLRRRFDRSGRISRSVIAELAGVAEEMGRVWEAEAWASVGMQLPEDDSVDLQQLRSELVSELRRDTPWQQVQGFSELELDLSHLEFDPAIERFLGKASSSASRPTPRIAQETDRPVQTQPSAGNGSAIHLVNEASDRGIQFMATTGDDLDQPGISLHQTLGCGGASLDFDLDGWCDLALMTAGGTPPKKDSSPNKLFRNQNGQFIETPFHAGVHDRGFAQGAAVGDINEDGLPDLLCLNYGPNVLLINQGDGTFRDASEQWLASADETRWSTGAAFADLDSDGMSDLVILNYCEGLSPVTFECGGDEANEPARSCSPMRFSGDHDQFFQTSPMGKLVDRTQQWKMLPADAGRGLGVVIGRFDSAPGNQVFVANDMTSNFYWSRLESPTDNDASVDEDSDSNVDTWAESALPRGLAVDGRSVAQGSMGIASDDFNGDGKIDFYVTNFDQEYNTLHLQTGPGSWRDSTMSVGLGPDTLPLVGFGTLSTDLSGDGRNELVVCNGHVDIFQRDDPAAETSSKSNRRSMYAQPMQIFRHDGAGRFQLADVTGEYLGLPHVGRSVWSIDANRDLRPDLAVTHQTEPVALLINHSKADHPRLHLRVAGTNTSRDAIGTRLTVRSGDWQRTHWVTSGGSYLSSHQPGWLLSCPAKTEMVNIEVIWPNDERQVFSGVTPDQEWLLVEGQPEPVSF
ncbi:FG-GAP-like repeat-containing protein [Rhodopirellula halodulae]|uniref:FG-GAP-like repeat-containing protein n=1 Tax=Rhodopirellula halodulae TaxID=2894198 RepID=UPI001E5F3455|nr:FG-GAP-like repeat-containing protein [Rhodopirellula sp. JC737]